MGIGLGGDNVHGLRAISSFGHDFDILGCADDLAQATAQKSVIVDQDKAYHIDFILQEGASGSLILTRVPRPG